MRRDPLKNVGGFINTSDKPLEVVNRWWLIIAIGFVYLSMVALSVYFLTLKRDSLSFHTRDYNYFIEQSARLTDPSLDNQFSMNIEGHNFLGLQGFEGVINLYHAIHTEYFRYTYVILYGIFKDTLPLYVFYSLIFFSPILYFAVLQKLRSMNAHTQTSARNRRGFTTNAKELRSVKPQSGLAAWGFAPVILFTLMYVLFPGVFNTVTYDLRPRVLFIPAWSLVILSIYFERPFIEKLVFFAFLLGIREEGILLGIIVIAFNFIRMSDKSGKWVQTAVFLSLDVLALVAFLAFMEWGQYDRVDAVYDPRNILQAVFSTYLELTVGLSVFILLIVGYLWLKKNERLNEFLSLLVYLGAVALSGSYLVSEGIRWYKIDGPSGIITIEEIYQNFGVSPTYALFFYMLILLLVLLLDNMHKDSRKIMLTGLSFLCIVFAALTFSNTKSQVEYWKQNLGPASLVWYFVETHNRYQADVLVDYNTYQSFFNYDNVNVYNRLPVRESLPEERYYPDNRFAVAKLIREQIQYVVISSESLEDVSELLELSGVQVSKTISNEHYVVLKLRN